MQRGKNKDKKGTVCEKWRTGITRVAKNITLEGEGGKKDKWFFGPIFRPPVKTLTCSD
jgi:hypothetical protein